MLRRPSTRSITARWYCPGERSGGRLAAAIQQADDEQTASLTATFSRTRTGSPPAMTQFGYTAMGEQTPPGS